MLASVQPPAPGRRPILIDDACRLLGKAKQTVYALACRGEIPNYKQGRTVYFFEDELLEWAKSKPTKNFAKKPNALYIKAHGVKGSVNVRKPDEDSFRVGKPVKTGKSASGIHFIADTRGCETGVFAKNHSRKLSFTPQKQNGIWLT